jgi:hypothetical protein
MHRGLLRRPAQHRPAALRLGRKQPLCPRGAGALPPARQGRSWSGAPPESEPVPSAPPPPHLLHQQRLAVGPPPEAQQDDRREVVAAAAGRGQGRRAEVRRLEGVPQVDRGRGACGRPPPPPPQQGSPGELRRLVAARDSGGGQSAEAFPPFDVERRHLARGRGGRRSNVLQARGCFRLVNTGGQQAGRPFGHAHKSGPRLPPRCRRGAVIRRARSGCAACVGAAPTLMPRSICSTTVSPPRM